MKTKFILATASLLVFLGVMSVLIIPDLASGTERSPESRATVQVTKTFTDAVSARQVDYFSVVAAAGKMTVSVSWSGSYDIDCYICKTASYLTYLARGYTTNNPETCSYTITTAGTYYIAVRMYTSTAPSTAYTCTVTYYEESASSDTTAPVVSITAPSNGATVTGTVAIATTATDNVDTTPTVQIKIASGSWITTTGSYSWDTTAVSDGSVTISAQATDDSGNVGTASITVTVDNTEETPGDTHFIGAVAGGEVDYYSIYAYPGTIAVSCSWSGTYDIDVYICSTASYTTYLARGYTTNNPETCSYTATAAGTYYIAVRMYTSAATSTSYDCHVTWQATEQEEPEPTGTKWAIIAGISDYEAISDLSYCDEDATDWYNYLVNTMGYATSNVRVLGDGHTSNYPAYYAIATEYNYRACLTWVADNVAAGETVVFDTSGHGSGTGTGSSYLCAWDCTSGESGYDGSFYDTEIDDCIGAISSQGAYVFVFIDHCYSGGIGPELMALSSSSYIYCTTTCTADGYGYDDSSHYNGAWTYWFLEAGLISHFGSSTTTTMEAAFDWASANYPYDGGDAPMEFDGSSGTTFLL